MRNYLMNFPSGVKSEGVRMKSDSKYEDNNAQMGRVASPKIQMLHLETVEETKGESRKPNEIGDSGMASKGSEQL